MPVNDDFTTPASNSGAADHRPHIRTTWQTWAPSRLLRGIVAAAASLALAVSVPVSAVADEADESDAPSQSAVTDSPGNEATGDDPTIEQTAGDESTSEATANEDATGDEATTQARESEQSRMVEAKAAGVCRPGVFYSQQAGGGIRQVDVSGSPPVSTNWSTWTKPTGGEMNALGIGKNGTPVYALQRRNENNQADQVRIYSFADNPNSPTLVYSQWYDTNTEAVVAGAVHPQTGDYYFGGYVQHGNHYDFKLFRYRVGSNGVGAISHIGNVNTQTNENANGDLAFDAKGNLYILHSSGSSAHFLTVSAATLDNAPVPPATNSHLATSSTAERTLTNLQNANGMTFDSNGSVIVSNGTTAYRFNPTSWQPIGGALTTSLGDSTDLASCITPAPPTLELVKNVLGRANASDQFQVAITDTVTPNSPFVTGTTAGSDTGLQDTPTEIAGPSIVLAGSVYTLSETMASGSVSNLDAYESSLSCTATYEDGTPAQNYQLTELTKTSAKASAQITLPATDPVKGNPAIRCVITNSPGPATLQVDKQWVVNGAAPVADGDQPDGLTATPTITVNGSAVQGAAWGTPVDSKRGASFEVSEEVELGDGWELCTLKQQITNVNGTATTIDASQAYTGTLDHAQNSIEYTNTVTCSTLTLVKNVDRPDLITALAPEEWTLTATAADQTLEPVTGAGYASARVKAGVAYTLNEAGDHPTYVQQGDWTCQLVTSVGADGHPNGFGDPVDVTGTGGNQVTVPEGKHVQCAVTNATAALTVLKEVPDDSGASFSEDDFTFSVDPGENNGSGLDVEEILGASTASEDNTVSVRPGHPYSVTEASNDPALAYVNTKVEQLDANDEWIAIDPSSITVDAGEHVTIRFVNVPPASAALPLTGAFDHLFTLIGGGGAALAAVAAAAWYVMRRKHAAGTAGSLLDD